MMGKIWSTKVILTAGNQEESNFRVSTDHEAIGVNK